MADEKLVVGEDMVVGIDYTLRLDTGDVVDASSDGRPLEFLQGRGQIIPGLERALNGLAVGDEKDIVVEPFDGYGELDPDAYQLVPLDVFPPDVSLEPGLTFEVQGSSGEPALASVAEVRPDCVLLDFNHLLAGERLFFHVRVASLRPATREELAHGHAHGHGHGHEH